MLKKTHTHTTASYDIGALATDNYFRIVQNTYMCFVTLWFSLIFKVCNLSFKYIFVITSYDSNNLINYVHASYDVLLIIVRDIVFSHVIVLFVPMANNAYVP
jgi:hypothetical protein